MSITADSTKYFASKMIRFATKIDRWKLFVQMQTAPPKKEKARRKVKHCARNYIS